MTDIIMFRSNPRSPESGMAGLLRKGWFIIHHPTVALSRSSSLSQAASKHHSFGFARAWHEGPRSTLWAVSGAIKKTSTRFWSSFFLGVSSVRLQESGHILSFQHAHPENIRMIWFPKKSLQNNVRVGQSPPSDQKLGARDSGSGRQVWWQHGTWDAKKLPSGNLT